MPWCPKCQMEYREGFDICADCHISLTDENPELKRSPRDLGEPVLLITVENEIEADILLDLLAEQQIPAFKKSCSAGMFCVGNTCLGAQVYVPQQLLEAARDVAEVLQSAVSGEDTLIFIETPLEKEEEADG